jgi:hypothetical protein
MNLNIQLLVPMSVKLNGKEDIGREKTQVIGVEAV